MMIVTWVTRYDVEYDQDCSRTAADGMMKKRNYVSLDILRRIMQDYFHFDINMACFS
jgi:hypothetical protein